MRIGPPQSEIAGVIGRVSAEVRRGNTVSPLWYEFPAEYLDYVTIDRSDAFLVAVLLQCMHVGEPLYIEGTISGTLLHNVSYYARAMRSLYPALHQVDISCEKVDWFYDSQRGSEIGASFSGGTDAMCTAYDNFTHADPQFRINRLVFVNVGTHGRGEFGADIFRQRQRRIEQTAKAIGLPVLVVDSNLDEHYTYRVDDSTCARIVSCVLLFQKLFHTYLFPSTNMYLDLCAEGSTPISDHLLSTEITRIVHDGAQYTRIEKTARIAEWPVAQRFLDVCSEETPGMRNCSHCVKCIRAMVTADMLGLRSRFERVFDFRDFERSKAMFVREMARKGIAAPNYYWREVVRYAEAHAYPLFPDDVRVITSEPKTEPAVKNQQVLTSAARRTIKAFWRRDVNLGDRVTPALLSHFGYEPQFASAREAEFIGAGSILQDVPSTFVGRIVGAGFEDEHQAKTFPKAEILAVRGRLTAERCGAPRDCLLADPGLLVRYLFPELPPIRHTLAIVPHYLDQNAPQLRALAARYPKEIVLVNIRAELKKVLTLIAASEYVLSSSLYGLIAADAFKKTNRWITLGDHLPSGLFKFWDYYSANGMTPRPISLNGTELLNRLVSGCSAKTTISADASTELLNRLQSERI